MKQTGGNRDPATILTILTALGGFLSTFTWKVRVRDRERRKTRVIPFT